MFSFFESVIQFFQFISQFLENIIVNTISFVQFLLFLPQSSIMLTGSPGLVPAVLSISIIIVCAVGVIKLILGWGNS